MALTSIFVRLPVHRSGESRLAVRSQIRCIRIPRAPSGVALAARPSTVSGTLAFNLVPAPGFESRAGCRPVSPPSPPSASNGL